MKDTVISDHFISWQQCNVVYRGSAKVELCWQDSKWVEYVEIRLKREYLAKLVGQDPEKWRALFHLDGPAGSLLLVGVPLVLEKEWGNIINRIIMAMKNPSAFVELIFEAKVLELLAGIIVQLQQPRKGDALRESHKRFAMQAKKEIDAIKGKWTFTTISLAEAVGTNETTLKKAFKTVYGKSIFRYFQEKNMQTALEALQAGQSISDVATRLGYNYSSHFTIAFKKMYGVPPSRFVR